MKRLFLTLILAVAMFAGLAPQTDMQAYAEDTIEVYSMQDIRSNVVKEEISLNILGIRGNIGDTVFITLQKSGNFICRNVPYTLTENDGTITTEVLNQLGPENNYGAGMEISVYADRYNNLKYRGYINAVFAELTDSGDKVMIGISTGDASPVPPELFYYGEMIYKLQFEIPKTEDYSITYQYEVLTDGADNSCPPVGMENNVPVSSEIPIVDTGRIETIGNFSRRELKIIFPVDTAVSNYRIQYRMAGDKVWQTEWSNETGICILQNIKESSLFEFRIAGYMKQTDGSWKRSKWSDISYRYMKAVKIRSVKAGRKCITVRWQKDNGCNGYRIRCYTHKSMHISDVVTKNIRNRNKTNYTFKYLKKGKKYYISVCPFKIKKGRVYQGI